MKHYEVIVLGGGTAGYTASIRSAQLGMNVLLIEQDKIGGTCLNYGCIPTKSLLASASLFRSLNKANTFGITFDNLSFDLSAMVHRKNQIVNRLVKGVEYLLKKNTVHSIKGKGVLLSDKQIQVNDEIVSYDKLILSTGSSSFVPDNVNLNSSRIATSKEILDSTEKIESLLIIGGGVIGCEFATLYHSLGTKVTIVELSDSLLIDVDKEISSELYKIFKNQGIVVLTNTTVQKLSEQNNKVKIEFSNGAQQEFDKVLLSVGRTPNLEGFGLDAYQLEMSGKFLKVDAFYQTSQPDIFAIGDIIGPPLLAHKASHDAVSVVESFIDSKPHSAQSIPSAIYTHPEIGSVGKTEEELLDKHQEYTKTKFAFFPIGKAKIIDETQGFIKILHHNNYILGAHIIGPNATELIPVFSLSIDNHIPLDKLSETIFSHPTISETIKETIDTILNKSINF